MQPIPFNMKGTEYAITIKGCHLLGRQPRYQTLSREFRAVDILGHSHHKSGWSAAKGLWFCQHKGHWQTVLCMD